MRREESLDSRSGIVRFDCDVLLHRYKTVEDKKSSRDIQCLMFIEVKTHGAMPTDAQRDTLSLFAQVLRNRRTNKHLKGKKHGLHAANHTPLTVAFSRLNNRRVTLKMFGGHLLRMSGNCPESSEWMSWDDARKSPEGFITVEQLKQLLRFELDPDTLREVDWRRRYSDFREQPNLFSLPT